MAKYEVKITSEAIHKHANDNVYDALCQIIYNGLDANAQKIEIDVMTTSIGGDDLKIEKVKSIKISDSGHGMSPEKIESYLTQYNKSWKRGGRRKDGRSFHGHQGIGRFKYFSLGKLLRWETLCNDEGTLKQREITTTYNNPKDFIVEDKPVTRTSEGTSVFIENVSDKAQVFLEKEKLIFELMKRFALYIQTNPQFELLLDGEKLIPDRFMDGEASGSFTFEDGEEKHQIEYRFIAWKHRFEFADHKHTFLFDKSYNYKGKNASGVQAGKALPYHTVFLVSDFYSKLSDYSEDYFDSFPKIKKLYREDLLKFLYGIRRKRSGELFKDFQNQSFYPFENSADDSVEAAERDIFNVCAMSLLEHDNQVLTNKNSSLRILFKLLRKLIEKNNDTAEIIAEILELGEKDNADFKKILGSTPLPNLITHYHEIQRRETFLDVLDTLVHDDFYKKHLRERTQLHKIVEKEVWVFGDDYDYQLGTSDQALTNVLQKHLKINELSEEDIDNIAEQIKHDAKKGNMLLKKIPDLYLWRKYSDSKQKNVKNLIVELKAPKVSLGIKEREQADKIYRGIAGAKGSGYTVDQNNRWEYYLVSSKITTELELCIPDKEKGILYQYENYTIYAVTWESIIRSARFALGQVKKQLEIKITEEHRASLLEKYLGDVCFSI